MGVVFAFGKDWQGLAFSNKCNRDLSCRRAVASETVGLLSSGCAEVKADRRTFGKLPGRCDIGCECVFQLGHIIIRPTSSRPARLDIGAFAARRVMLLSEAVRARRGGRGAPRPLFAICLLLCVFHSVVVFGLI